jgi:prepilin-type processing-associated H-X9-DG protein
MSDMMPEDGAVPSRLRKLGLLSLILAAPMCLGTVIVLPFSRILYTVSRIPMIAYWLFFGTSVVSVMVGVMATWRVGRFDKGRRYARAAYLGMTLGVLGILAAGILPRDVFMSHDMAVTEVCRRNLKQIGAVLLLYAEENSGQFPPSFQTLVNRGCEPRLFMCPVRSKESGPLDPQDVDATGDYCYGRIAGADAPPMVPIVWDRLPNHYGGGTMLFVDGHAVWAPSEQMCRDIENWRAYYVTAPELPPPPPTPEQ